MLHKLITNKKEAIVFLEGFLNQSEPISEIYIDYNDTEMKLKLTSDKPAKQSVVDATFGVMKIDKRILDEILSEEDFYGT